MRRIALVNQKGGCGKTTTSINLASFLSHKGRKVLLIDLDPQGHSGLGLGFKAGETDSGIYEVLTGKTPLAVAVQPLKENLDVVVSDIVLSAFEQVMAGVPEREYKLSQSLDGVHEKYDYLIIDSPPSVGLLTFNGLMASDEVIIPVDPSYFSLHGLRKLLETLKIIEERVSHHLSIKILPTILDMRTTFGKGVLETLSTHFPETCFRTFIHSCTRLREAASLGMPILDYDRHCNAYNDYHQLAEEVLSAEGRVEEWSGKDLFVNASDGSGAKDIIFTIDAPPDAKVQIAGDFNSWKPEALHYRDHFGNPAWQKLFSLTPGMYQYKYLVNGKWITDPGNTETIQNGFGETNSLVNV